MLILSSPVLLVAAWTVLIDAPLDVFSGTRQVFSGHDVVQVADGFDATVTIALWAVLGGLGLLMPGRWDSFDLSSFQAGSAPFAEHRACLAEAERIIGSLLDPCDRGYGIRLFG